MALPRLFWMWLLVAGTRGELSPSQKTQSAPCPALVPGVSSGSLFCWTPQLSQVVWLYLLGAKETLGT